MTNKEHEQRVVDALAEDVLKAADEELLAELTEDFGKADEALESTRNSINAALSEKSQNLARKQRKEIA